MRLHVAGSAAVALLLLCAGTLEAQEPATFAQAIAAGNTGMKLRYRYEFVDDADFGKNANASTLLLRLNHRTATWRRWSAFAEFDYLFELWPKDFNSAAGTSGPGRDIYPVVADPAGPDLNQLYFQYQPDEALRVRLGRQRILLDDERYVGGVGWRQNEQTYDALSFNYTGLDRTTVFYSYVANVARIFGSSVPAGSHEQSTHLLHANVELSKAWSVTGYAYLIDNDDAPDFSTNTFGARLVGGIPVNDARLALHLEFARQAEAGNAPVAFDAGYLRAEALWETGPLGAGIGIELLESNNGQGFRTPLATLHAFNGWADRFLSTPSAGLEDRYVKANFKTGDWNIQLRYHDFKSDVGNEDFGSELDASAATRIAERYALLLKLAVFDGSDGPFADTTRAWVMVTRDF